jgi:hypothetical protein
MGHGVWSHIGLSMHSFTRPKEGKTRWFFMFRESEKDLKDNSMDVIFCKFSPPSPKKCKTIQGRTLLVMID